MENDPSRVGPTVIVAWEVFQTPAISGYGLLAGVDTAGTGTEFDDGATNDGAVVGLETMTGAGDPHEASSSAAQAGNWQKNICFMMNEFAIVVDVQV